MKKCFAKLYHGYGDNVWQYPFVKQLSVKYDVVYLQTYFPFLFKHLDNVVFIKPVAKTNLETCKKSYQDHQKLYSQEVSDRVKLDGIDVIKFPYYLSEFKTGKNVVEIFSQAVPTSDEILNTPLVIPEEDSNRARALISKLKEKDKMLCLVRPPANRKDWNCSARTPKPEYFQYLMDKYKKYFTFVSIGNKSVDVYEKELQGLDHKFDNGELDLGLINALTKEVDLILTYNCFLYALGVKNKTKTIVINGGYTDPLDYVCPKRMDLKHVAIVNPINLCKCVQLQHDCDKNIDIKELDGAIEKVFKINENKQNLLVSRIRAGRAEALMNNPYVKANYNVYTVDHTGLFDYKNKGFIKSYQFPPCGNVCYPKITKDLEQKIYEFCRGILKENQIDKVINAQPLHPYHTIMAKVCSEFNVDVLNYETFFENKWVLDRTGIQYTYDNDLNRYVEKIDWKDYRDNLPNRSRENQPEKISQEEVYKKYDLNSKNKHVVVFGQLLWDMSLKKKLCEDVKNPVDFYTKLFSKNPDTVFLFKIHPKISRDHKDMRFLKSFSNVCLINEGLSTLFDSFDCFVSFSSHCILEGIIQNKKFASGGFHYVNHPRLVYQISKLDDFNNIYEKIKSMNIHEETRDKYLNFIINKYTCSVYSKKIFDRINLPSYEYFVGEPNE